MTRPHATALLRWAAILIIGCAPVLAQDDDPSNRSPRILSEKKMAEAVSICEAPRSIEDSKRQGETIDMPAICKAGTTPESVRIEMSMVDIGKDAELFRVMSPWANQTWELHLKLSRRVREFGGCEWTNYGGYGVFPYATVSINQSSALNEPELNGVDWAAGIKDVANLRADKDFSVIFDQDHIMGSSDLPLDCSAPRTLKAKMTPNWSDDLRPEELEKAMRITVTPVVK